MSTAIPDVPSTDLLSAGETLRGYYRLPPTTDDDLRALATWVERYQRGEVAHAKFRGFRVPLGIYEQRAGNVYMMRVRLPGGAVTPAQLRGLARLTRQYGVKPHVTTRQDIQLQDTPLESLVPLYRELRALGLSCKGGGGNTVRNITACPDAGVCTKELFDVLPYAVALTEYLLASPSSYNLPRKFKVAFSGCSGDGAMATVNDLGFIAKQREGEPGFSVYAGGGMGGHSAVAVRLSEFVPAAEVGTVAEAVKRLFDRHGDRANKHKARLRFVVQRVGEAAFRDMFEEELRRVQAEGGVHLELPGAWEERGREKSVPLVAPVDAEYEAWRDQRVSSQRQEGYSLVRVPLPLGDLDGATMETLAEVADTLGVGALRTTPTQDLMFRWVPPRALPYLYNKLRACGLADTNTRNLDHMVCCKGADTCRQGLCLSGGLCAAVAAELDRVGVDLARMAEVSLFVSGCPNACGKHPVGSIGVYGVARRIEGRAVPFYHVAVGGRVHEGLTTLAESRGGLPARHVPALLRDFLLRYQEQRESAGSFERFLATDGETYLSSLFERYKGVPAYEEDASFYRDFGSDEDFSLAGRGPGECGSGVFDMIESDLAEARAAYAEWEQSEASESLYHSVCALARSLLVLRGLDCTEDLESLREFRRLFVEPGWVARRYEGLLEAAESYRETSDGEPLRRAAELAPQLAERIKVLYESIDAELQFRVEPEDAPVTTDAVTDEAPDSAPPELLDLRGVKCPMNYVRAKLVLEELPAGTLLDLLLDDGEPIQNVPKSLENDGQKLLSLDADGEGHFRVRVRKER